MNVPHRRIETTIKISADDTESLIAAFRQLIFEAGSGKYPGGSVSGGYAWGWEISTFVDENQTHEKYAAELAAYLKTLDAERGD